ncbi:MAG: hypothetical protein AAF598_16990 [Bacteroidota bacterium]
MSASIQGMINAYKNNVKHIRKRVRFKGLKQKETFLNKESSDFKIEPKALQFRTGTPEEIAASRAAIRAHFKRQGIIALIFLFIGLASTAIIANHFFHLRQRIKEIPPELIVNDPTPYKERLEKFHYYLQDGDEWYRGKLYHNAAFQYRRAVELFPENENALLKLTQASLFACQLEDRHCASIPDLLKDLAQLEIDPGQLMTLKAQYSVLEVELNH